MLRVGSWLSGKKPGSASTQSLDSLAEAQERKLSPRICRDRSVDDRLIVICDGLQLRMLCEVCSSHMNMILKSSG